MHPSAGLKAMFDQRAAIMRNEIAEVRKAKGQPATAKPAEKKESPPAAASKEGAPSRPRPRSRSASRRSRAAPRYPRPEGSPGLGAGSGWEIVEPIDSFSRPCGPGADSKPS